MPSLNPFHGMERNSPATIKHCFLQFRSLVYQKSLVLSLPSETEPIETRSIKSSSSIGVSGEIVRDMPAQNQQNTWPDLFILQRLGRNVFHLNGKKKMQQRD
ncbi:hypothetical protein Dsin_024133 [Dipteronia sinensis]|uniref:Uncharacterized protein n=1 Tax=Dipteronia sinensis TaxID=43782 RepID=A0AAE0A4Y6_9ROSI|nr:hypothetical protein Dsin_024133 [Dipteronia sinensis]